MAQRSSLIIRIIWAACLLVATANHAGILLAHGLAWDYGGVGLASALYWSSLTLIDPIIAAPLFVRPKAGIVSTLILMATNVLHNSALKARSAPGSEFLANAAADPFLISQIAFLIFVGATARIAWKGADQRGVGTAKVAAL